MNKLQLNQDRWQQQFETLLAEEGLTDRDQFLQPLDEFDEVPLYTRESRVSFLDEADHRERNVLLLGYALQYADSIVELAAKRLARPFLQDFFLMITVMNWDDYYEGGLVKPCFWTTRHAHTELQQMKLATVYTEPGLKIESWLRDIDGASEYQVADYAAACTDNALMRVHVAHKRLPHDEMPTINSLIIK